MIDVPSARLAEIMPAKWSETRRRIVAIRRLRQEEDQSGPTIMRYARELGVSRQMIYKLLRIVDDWDGAADRPADPTRWSQRGGERAVVVHEALAELGSGASAERVLTRAGEIASARGVSPPTRPQVYTAMGRSGAGTALARRLRLTRGGVLLDAAPLSVGVAGDDPHRPAVLAGACDLDRGGLAAWTVTDGFPDGAAISGLVASAGVPSSEVPMATAALRGVGAPVDLATPPTRLRAGSALRAAIGGTVGRIRLLPQPAVTEGVAVPLVSPDDLRDVLREVLGSRDALDASLP